MKRKGFTVVELIVIIVVIGVLAGITIVSYSFLKDDAMDTKIRSAVKTAGDAMVLYENNTGSRPASKGYFSGTSGFDDSLIPKYLNEGYRDGISSVNTTNASRVFRWYDCGGSGGGFVIYASLNSPTGDDVSSFQKIRTSCGHSDTQAPTSGGDRYNYAKVF